MRRRRGPAEESLAELEQRRTKLASDLERQEAALADAQHAVSEARELEAAAVLDDPDPAGARQRRSETEAALVAATGDLDVLRRAIDLLDRRLEEARAQADEEAGRAALAAYELACRERDTLIVAFFENPNAATHEAMVASRERARVCRQALSEFAVEIGFDDDEPVVDKDVARAAADTLEQVVAALRAGTVQERAATRATREHNQRETARRDAEKLQRFLFETRGVEPEHWSLEQRLEVLPEPQQSQWRRAHAKAHAEFRERQERDLPHRGGVEPFQRIRV